MFLSFDCASRLYDNALSRYVTIFNEIIFLFCDFFLPLFKCFEKVIQYD